MKLASYRDGSRDGQLLVVSRDLTTAHYATGIATRLQQVLDDWNFVSPQLEDLYRTLNGGKARHAFAFDPCRCAAPLPRACGWAHAVERAASVQASADDAHAAPSNAAAPGPVMVHGASDHLLGPCDDIVAASEDGLGIDGVAQLAVITGDIPRGASPEAALEGVRLLVLVNDVSLRSLVADEPADRAAGRLATAFGPVAVTPDELGPAWHGGRLHRAVEATRNGRRVGPCDAGAGTRFHFGELVSQLARLRDVRAGTVVGSGTLAQGDGSRGAPQAGFMKAGDTVRIEVKDADGTSVFGAIEQRVAPPSVGSGEGT